MSKDCDLRGKDYLTQTEAAHYCGVSESQFRARALEYGLTPRPFMGKLLFRRADLQAAIEQAWRRLDGEGQRGISAGRRTAKSVSVA